MNTRDPQEVAAWRQELVLMRARLPPGPYLATVARSIELIDALYPPKQLQYFLRQQQRGRLPTDRYQEGYDKGYDAGYRTALLELQDEINDRLHPAEADPYDDD